MPSFPSRFFSLASRFFFRAALVFFLVDLSGCRGLQQLRDGCTPSSGVACPPCSSDQDCYILSNPCLASATCVSRGSTWGVISIGCSKHREFIPPPREQCRCIDKVCRIP